MQGVWPRRSVLIGAAAAAGTLSFPAAALARRKELQIDLLGQSLIQHDLCGRPWSGLGALKARLGQADAVFSDLETAIRGPRAGAPTRVLDTLHVAEPTVIACLRRLGINLLATSNNHAFDIGTGGIVDAIAALRAQGVAFAGTGLTIEEASGPAFLQTAKARVALIAFATGMIREGGTATAERPGVAEIRRESSGELNAADVERTLGSIGAASRDAELVIAYQHNHLWDADNSVTPEWQRRLARRCVDAGAGVYVAHGAPLLQGMEVYRGRPLFHGLGSFIFQTKKAPEAYGEHAWQSLIAECRFRAGRFEGARLIPVQLNPTGEGGIADLATRGRPSLAGGPDARRILERLSFLSARLGYRLRHDGRVATLRASAAR